MQTFLPLPDFFRSIEVLDTKRLGKQRVEALQLLNTFSPEYSLRGWLKHPARTMWSGYPSALAFYGILACRRWVGLGYRDSCREKILLSLSRSTSSAEDETGLEQRYFAALSGDDRAFLPRWFGMEIFHRSHRSNLLRKDPYWYGQYGWSESPDIPYFWPDAVSV